MMWFFLQRHKTEKQDMWTSKQKQTPQQTRTTHSHFNREHHEICIPTWLLPELKIHALWWPESIGFTTQS